MVEHTWDFCYHCLTPVVICGYCGNNCCNGGSGEGCTDLCRSAYEFQDKWDDCPEELLRLSDRLNILSNLDLSEVKAELTKQLTDKEVGVLLDRFLWWRGRYG